MNVAKIQAATFSGSVSPDSQFNAAGASHFDQLLNSVRNGSHEQSVYQSSRPSGVNHMFQAVDGSMNRVLKDAMMAPKVFASMDIQSAHQWNMNRVMNAHLANAMYNTSLGVASGVKGGLKQLIQNQ